MAIQVKNITGVVCFLRNDTVKRETGENPVRTRRCNEGVLFYMSLANAEKTEQGVDI